MESVRRNGAKGTTASGLWKGVRETTLIRHRRFIMTQWVSGMILCMGRIVMYATRVMESNIEHLAVKFPPGTPVRVTQHVRTRVADYEAETVGLVEAWDALPTGSWHAHGRGDKYWLSRLKLRKADGEITLLVLDDSTRIARLEAAAPSPKKA